MREIKFRCWNKKDKHFLMSEVDTAKFFELITDVDEYEHPQQFTGLKDSNGKEIYEGDICKEFFNRKENIGEVKFSPTQGYTVGGKAIWPHDIEILGNIYENPELLK